jgi:hypothetical protein
MNFIALVNVIIVQPYLERLRLKCSKCGILQDFRATAFVLGDNKRRNRQNLQCIARCTAY